MVQGRVPMNEYVWNCVCGKSIRVKATAVEHAQREAIQGGWSFMATGNPPKRTFACCSADCRRKREKGART